MAFNAATSTYLIDSAGGVFLHDLAARQTLRLADFAVQFTDIAITPEGRIFANSFSALYEVDIAGGQLTTIRSLSSSANGLASDGAGRLYVGYLSSNRIDVLNATTFALERTITLPSATRLAGDILIVGETLYYTSTARQLLTVDLATDSLLSTVTHGLTAAFGLHELEGALYAFSGDGVYVIDRATGGITAGYGLIDAQFSSTVFGAATAPVIRVAGTEAADTLVARFSGLVLDGGAGNDTILGSDGAETLIGGIGDDFLFGGPAMAADLRDVIYGGDGQDSIDGGWGNDDLSGGNGHDTVLGDFGADTVIGNAGDDLLAGSAGADLMFGNAGNDTLNGGFGFDRLNGGTGADSFFHAGVAGHASDWVQDYNAAEGDVLTLGLAGATRAQLQVNFTPTPGAGDAGVAKAFIIYRPTGQILWALVDGGDDAVINAQIGGQVFDLMAP